MCNGVPNHGVGDSSHLEARLLVPALSSILFCHVQNGGNSSLWRSVVNTTYSRVGPGGHWPILSARVVLGMKEEGPSADQRQRLGPGQDRRGWAPAAPRPPEQKQRDPQLCVQGLVGGGIGEGVRLRRELAEPAAGLSPGACAPDRPLPVTGRWRARMGGLDARLRLAPL